MNAFWEGFEKRAKAWTRAEQAELDERRKDTFKALGAGVLATGGALGLTNLGSQVDPRLAPKDAVRLGNDILNQTKNNSTRAIIGAAPEDLRSFYDARKDVAGVPMHPRSGYLAHEIGHANSMGKLLRKNKLLGEAWLGAYNVGKYAPVLQASLMMSEDEAAREKAPYGALLATPTILEEAMATGRGLHSLYKTRGGKAALKAAPGLAGAFSTYLAVPGGMALAAHYLNKKRKKQESDARKTKTTSPVKE